MNSTKNLTITYVTIIMLIVNLLAAPNPHLMINRMGFNLHRVRIENLPKIKFGQININSVRNKFDLVINIIKNEIDIFVISETKIDNSLRKSKFTMAGYSIPFRLYMTGHGGGILSL